MKRLGQTLFAAAAMILISSGIAFAHGGGGVCKDDVKKYCADTQSGKGAIFKCLESHQKELSPACQTKLEEKKAAKAACQADRDKFCKDQHGKEGFQCMVSHQKDLSDQCRTHILKRAERHQKKTTSYWRMLQDLTA